MASPRATPGGFSFGAQTGLKLLLAVKYFEAACSLGHYELFPVRRRMAGAGHSGGRQRLENIRVDGGNPGPD